MSRLDKALDGIENPDKEDHYDIVHITKRKIDYNAILAIINEVCPDTHKAHKSTPKSKQKKPPTVKVEKSVDVVKKNISNVKKPTNKQLADAKLALFKKSSMFKIFNKVIPESTMTVANNGDKVWHNSSGHYHRTDGPAVEYPDGSKEWWIDGKELSEEQFNSYNN